MSSVLSSQGVVLATAMAVSGTVILLAFRLQKSLPLSLFPFPLSPHHVLRSCFSSEGKKKKKKKRVHFAEDVVDPRGDGKEFRRRKHSNAIVVVQNCSSSSSSSSYTSPSSPKLKNINGGAKEMPANRAALYHGILRDRVVQRLTYSY